MKAPLKAFLRYKWTFVCTTLVCWLAAGIYYFQTVPPYVSEAKVMVRYVVESPIDGPSRGVGPEMLDLMVKSEVEILTSRELAEKVVNEVGADRLSKDGGKADAVSAVSRGLLVRREKESPVIQMVFRHDDAETARAALEAVIHHYFIKHRELHRGANPIAGFRGEVLKGLAAFGSAGVFASTRAEREADSMLSEQIPNVSVIEAPTPAVEDPERRNQILFGMIAGGPVLGALAVFVLAMLRKSRKHQAGAARA